MARITRKELKTDKFALEVEHGLTFFEEHQQAIIRYTAIALAVVALVFAFNLYRRHGATNRQEALARAITVQETPVGPVNPSAPSASTFPTQQVKDQAAIKAFTDLRTKYSGSDEAEIAQYYLASIYADQGNLGEAEKGFQEVAAKGNERYASLAKLSLAQVYFSQAKMDQAQTTLKDVAAHPTVFVSADQANIALARGIMTTKPAEARKILDGLRNRQGTVGQVALQLYGQLPPQ